MNRGKKILVVEDDQSIREVMEYVLSSEDYEVVTALNGRDALNQLKNGLAPNLIFLDIMMPVMSGPEFLEAVSKDEAINRIAIVITSATGENLEKFEHIRRLQKPLELALVLKVAAEYCQSQAPAVGESHRACL